MVDKLIRDLLVKVKELGMDGSAAQDGPKTANLALPRPLGYNEQDKFQHYLLAYPGLAWFSNDDGGTQWTVQLKEIPIPAPAVVAALIQPVPTMQSPRRTWAIQRHCPSVPRAMPLPMPVTGSGG